MGVFMKQKFLASAVALAVVAGSASANASIIPITFNSNGQASLPFFSFVNTGFNSTTGTITQLVNDYTFTLKDDVYLVSSGLSGSSNAIKATTKTGGKTYPNIDPEITGSLTLYSGTPGSGVEVVQVGAVNNSPIVGSTGGSTYSYSAGVGEFTLDPGKYYLAVDYSYAPNYLNTKTGKYALVSGAGGSLSGTASIVAVPEPSTWAMLGMGFAGIGLLGVTKRRKASRYAL